MRIFFVYIMASLSRTLYVGFKNHLRLRVIEHKQEVVPGFTGKYKVNRLVYFERFNDPRLAIEREKQKKGWTRAKKIALVESANLGWLDLSQGLVAHEVDPSPSLRMTGGTSLRMTSTQRPRSTR